MEANHFIELLQISLGIRNSFSEVPTAEKWDALYDESEKQSVSGFMLAGIEKLPKDQRPPQELLLQWIGVGQIIEQQNKLVNERCVDIAKFFDDSGFRSCILKGQGTSLYYSNSQYRQSGDIDIWVNGRRDVILEFIKKKGFIIGSVDIKHSDVDFFEDVPVEVHFIPSWMFSPFKNERLQRIFAKQADCQFNNKDIKVGFTHTTIEFDLVYSLVHIYRHVFEEGVGLRQLLDYYHILIHSDRQQRKDAYTQLKVLGMRKFVGGVMYMLHECFKLESEYFVCAPNVRHGRFLLSEILAAGNFGHYDSRYQHKASEERFANGLITLKRDMRYLCYYPSEVIWMPFWKLWHWCWRKKKGYL